MSKQRQPKQVRRFTTFLKVPVLPLYVWVCPQV